MATTKEPSLVPVLVRVKVLVTIWHSATKGPKSTVKGEMERMGDGGMLCVCVCEYIIVVISSSIGTCSYTLEFFQLLLES